MGLIEKYDRDTLRKFCWVYSAAHFKERFPRFPRFYTGTVAALSENLVQRFKLESGWETLQNPLVSTHEISSEKGTFCAVVKSQTSCSPLGPLALWIWVEE